MPTQSIRHLTLIGGLLGALLTTSSREAVAQEGWPSGEPLADGPVTVGRDWAELRFPPLELSNTGCPFPFSGQSGEREKRYAWGVQNRFSDATANDDHFVSLYVLFQLPERVPMTDARLDSALAAADIKVIEYRGDAPSPVASVAPQRAMAQREGRSVRIRIEGEHAVKALLRPGQDSIDISWCRRDETTPKLSPRTRIVRQ